MAGEWSETTLGDLVTFQSGGTPSKDNASYWTGTIPWVSAKDMKQLFLEDSEDHITETGVANGTKLVPANTVLMLARGMTLLNDVPICIVRKPMTFNQDVKALHPKAGLKGAFLPYLLLGNKSRLLSMVDLAGHGTGRLNTEELKQLDVQLPPPSEQQAIACILGALDDKIELNRRRNRTLQSMARAIFQSWFVDFDPVRAKAEGRAPAGLSKEVAALFPAALEDSTLGPIPQGWRVSMLGEVADNPRRGTAADSITAGTPYIALEHMPRRNIALAEWSHADDIESNKFEFQKGEILFGKLRPYFHKVGIAPVDGVCSTDILVVAPKHADWFGFAAGHFSSNALVQHADRTSGGTKMPRTNWNDLARFEVAVPPAEVARAFATHFRAAIERIHNSIQESRTLAALRDALLPKLISGELRVPDAERIVGRGV